MCMCAPFSLSFFPFNESNHSEHTWTICVCVRVCVDVCVSVGLVDVSHTLGSLLRSLHVFIICYCAVAHAWKAFIFFSSSMCVRVQIHPWESALINNLLLLWTNVDLRVFPSPCLSLLAAVVDQRMKTMVVAFFFLLSLSLFFPSTLEHSPN